MERKRIQPNLGDIPARFHPLFEGAKVYDSSCSAVAQVLFIDKEDGFFLKSAPVGSLKREAVMTEWFHGKGLAAEVLAYEEDTQDWLLTRRLPGEDCIHRAYLDQPEQLCDILGERLRQLHELDGGDCPGKDKMDEYVALAEMNYRSGNYDASQFPDSFGYASAEEAWQVIQRYGHLLQRDTVLHGDYCLPNIMLDNWKFSGFVDVDHGGLGDKHIDLFWGAWSLGFNLKTDRFCQRFFDAYGRDKIEPELLRVVAAFEVFG